MENGISCGLLLAGGRSSRMGEDKALLPIEGMPIIYHLVKSMLAFADCVIIAAGEESREPVYRRNLAELGDSGSVRFVFDGPAYGAGPLAGLAAGLLQADEGYVFVTACDMPRISLPYVQELAAAGRSGTDVIHAPNQPFHALYHTRVKTSVSRALHEGDYRVMKLLNGLHTVVLAPAGEEAAFDNLNTPDDYRKYTRSRGGET